MKSILKITLILACSATALKAATISVLNFDSSASIFQPILDSSGTSVVNSGIVLLGTFASEPSSVSDVLGLGFTATDGSLSFTNGYFDGTINTQALTSGDAFVGKSVYVVIGNGTTLANSTLIGAWKAVSNTAGNTFTADNPVGGPDTITVYASSGSVLVGTQLSSYNNSQNIGPAFQLAAVPEPSAILLTALGVFGLLLRRKR